MAGPATIVASLLLVACACCIFPTGETSGGGGSPGLLAAKAFKGLGVMEGGGTEQPGAEGGAKGPGSITASVSAAEKEPTAGWMLTHSFSLTL